MTRADKVLARCVAFLAFASNAEATPSRLACLKSNDPEHVQRIEMRGAFPSTARYSAAASSSLPCPWDDLGLLEPSPDLFGRCRTSLQLGRQVTHEPRPRNRCSGFQIGEEIVHAIAGNLAAYDNTTRSGYTQLHPLTLGRVLRPLPSPRLGIGGEGNKGFSPSG